MDDLADRTADRFGNRLNAHIGTRSVRTLTRPTRAGSGLWREVLAEGIPLLRPAA